MLFITYWELNEAMSEVERLPVGQKLMTLGLFPPAGVNIIRWDATPDGWGILIAEANSAADINRAINMWRAAGNGFFKFTKTAPAMPVQEMMPLIGELLQTLSAT
jgi:hypothetical protein